MWGMKKGYFAKNGIDLEVRDTTFNEQIEFTAGGGCDIAPCRVSRMFEAPVQRTLALFSGASKCFERPTNSRAALTLSSSATSRWRNVARP